MKTFTFLATMMVILVASSVRAQTQAPDPPSKIEVGVQFSSLSLSPQPDVTGGSVTGATRSTEAGFGGRFTFNLNRNIALEAEGNFFPHQNLNDPASGRRLLQGQFGLKAGKRFGKFGIFAKARPGFASFSKATAQIGTAPLDINGTIVNVPIFGLRRQTHFSMDLGGVLEFYPSRKLLTRIDIGDTIIRYGDGSPFPGGLGIGGGPRTGTAHDLQVSAGIGFRLGSLAPKEPSPQANQPKQQRFEVGAQFSSLSFAEVERSPASPPVPSSEFRDTRTQLGFGGRLTYNLNSNFALEVQGDFFPVDARFFNAGRAGGRALQGQAGVKLGKRFQNFGIFGKARPGVVSFGNTITFDGFDNSQGFPVPLYRLERRTYFSMDLGGVLEFYPSRRIVTRFDGGDTMIRYGGNELPFGFSGLNVSPPETLHSFEFSAGVGFRF